MRSRRVCLFSIVIAAAAGLRGQGFLLSTVAGGAAPKTPVAATQVTITGIGGVAADGQGGVYFTALDCVFRVDASGVMTRVAGNARAGFSGDGGPATGAQLWAPGGLALDGAGNLYIADTGNARVRKVTAGGVITTVAGGGDAVLGAPMGVAVDGPGNLYIADSGSNRIWKVAAGGGMTVAAGGGHGLIGWDGDGGPATSAVLANPSGVAVDGGGNLFIADTNHYRVRKVTAAGIITTVAGSGVEGNSGGGSAATSAQLGQVMGVAVDGAGNVYIADSESQRIWKVTTDGAITTVAGNGGYGGYGGYGGDGGRATRALLFNPLGVAVDAQGNVFIADADNDRIRKVNAAGIITTIAGDGDFNTYSGDGGPAVEAQLDYPRGVTVDGSGNLFLADTGNERVRMVTAAGVIGTVAGNTAPWLRSPVAVAADGNGNVYVADDIGARVMKVSAGGAVGVFAGTGVVGYAGDGGAAVNAELDSPSAVAVDAAGNVYIAEEGNHVVRKVDAAGTITTVAGNGSAGFSGDGGPARSAMLDAPGGLAVDGAGNLYIADSGSGRIRKVAAGGTITRVAGNGVQGFAGDGGPAVNAEFNYPRGLAVDGKGNLYIADAFNNRVRMVTAGGLIFTVAGDGEAGYAGDGGVAAGGRLNAPMGVAVDGQGNVYVADAGNNAVRRLTASEAACGYAVSPAVVETVAAGGTVTLNVKAGAGCEWAVSGLPGWITVAGGVPGAGAGEVAIEVAANGGAARSVQIEVAGLGVTVRQASSVLEVSAGGVVNGASYQGSVAPGSIAAVFGNFLLGAPVMAASLPLPEDLGGLSFEMGGTAGMFYASLFQANVQVPWEAAGRSAVTVSAALSGQRSAPQMVSVAEYAPGIFAVNGQGTGQGAILDGANRVVDASNPARAGVTVVQIFCTGLGPVTNRPATGEAAPGNPAAETTARPVVTIGGVAAEVRFSGLAPGMVGLYQVNALTPNGVKGSAAPVVISIGGVSSNTVTMAVE